MLQSTYQWNVNGPLPERLKSCGLHIRACYIAGPKNWLKVRSTLQSFSSLISEMSFLADSCTIVYLEFRQPLSRLLSFASDSWFDSPTSISIIEYTQRGIIDLNHRPSMGASCTVSTLKMRTIIISHFSEWLPVSCVLEQLHAQPMKVDCN